MLLRSPSPTLFPYTTLFRSVVAALLRRRQPHPAQRVARVVLRHGEPPARVRGLPVGVPAPVGDPDAAARTHHRIQDRKSTRLNSSHTVISYAVFCLKKKKQK